MGHWDTDKIDTLVGRTLTSVKQGDDDITFVTTDGETYRMYHSQDCCESVYIEDINGDLNDLVGSPITLAGESTSSDVQEWEDKEAYRDSFTWTFYRFATVKGYVNIRWYGSSNGYYSESVSFKKI
jgi:hypothetical protein